MENILELCTIDRQSVHTKVLDGLTKVFFGTDLKTRDEAKRYALQKKSYFYEVHGKDKNNQSEWVGYAIPK